MREFFGDAHTAEKCKILRMLEEQAQKRHLSFHTPGHKLCGYDITELSYSDNLSCPRGCIAEAEQDIAQILGAEQSFILTDGSTSGVLSMLQAVKDAGANSVLVPLFSHKSVFNGCRALGLKCFILPQEENGGIPAPLCVQKLTGELWDFFAAADAVFVTSPDYYGRTLPLKELSALCKQHGKALLVDGAHGGHLHFDRTLYAGAYADMWVDGVHKSLPALTQGAVVSTNKKYAEYLSGAVDIFRTSSPSYPIMASVEYAVKFPRNTGLENEVKAFVNAQERVLKNDDWTKLCAVFGKHALKAERELETKGVYAEFCDGNILCFYLSPATKAEDFSALKGLLLSLFDKYPYQAKNAVNSVEIAPISAETEGEWVTLDESVGRTCAMVCGMFPPCTPLIVKGEKVTKEKVELLKRADNVFGLKEGKLFAVKQK